MARPTVLEAIEAYDERKDAAGAKVSGGYTEDVVRLVLSGLDIDIDDLLSVQHVVLPAPISSLAAGDDPRLVIFGMWADGLATGLFLARLRAEAES